MSLLGANFAFAENAKHKRFDNQKHNKFLEDKKVKRILKDSALKEESLNIEKLVAEMKMKQSEMNKGNHAKK